MDINKKRRYSKLLMEGWGLKLHHVVERKGVRILKKHHMINGRPLTPFTQKLQKNVYYRCMHYAVSIISNNYLDFISYSLNIFYPTNF